MKLNPSSHASLPQGFGKPAFGLACVLLALTSSGCRRGGWENDDNYAPFTPHAAPSAVTNQITLGSANTQPSSPDPQLARSGDPMVQVSDPLASDQQAQASAGSRLADNSASGTTHGGGTMQGWYWIVGNIQSGQIAISVNGVPLGRYSVHVDQEITKYCHSGLNTLTFTHYPLLGSSEQLCAARLEILNGHAAKGAPPLMVYDTTGEVEPSTPQPSAPSTPSPSDSSVLSPDGGNTDPSGDATDDQPAIATTPASTSNAPYSDERSFSGA